MFSASIYFTFSQATDADILNVGSFCYVLSMWRSFLYWACFFLLLIAIWNLTKANELESSKVKDKRCDRASKLWKSIIICFEIIIFGKDLKYTWKKIK